MQTIRIALTGGGTAGHVMPHFALLPKFNDLGWRYFYVGSHGIEHKIVGDAGIPFHQIAAGKLRRYVSWENFVDIFRVLAGIFQCVFLFWRHRPHLVFSKGGYVSVPVCIAAYVLRIPIVTHESDLTPGLATKIIAKFATHILYTFPESGQYLPKRATYVGAAVRQELFLGSRRRGLAFCGFREDDPRPIVLVSGGSLGAQKINTALKEALPQLLLSHRVVHLAGKGKTIGFTGDGYCGFEYVGAELKDLFAAADLVVGRAGANSIFEFLSLELPMLLIPLEAGSRGDQVLNAESFAAQGWAMILSEAELGPESFLEHVLKLDRCSKDIRFKQSNYSPAGSLQKIVDELKAVAVAAK